MRTTNIIIRKRIALLFVCAIGLLFLLIVRLAYIQFVRGEELSKKAATYRMREVPVEAKRGTIYDRNMNELVISISSDSVYAIPSHIKDKEGTAQKLAEILNMDEETILQKLKRKSSFEWIKRKIDWDTAQKIKALKLKGIGFAEESKRFYKQESLAPHVLGFTGVDNQGLIGIEKVYDDRLKGVPGKIVVEYDAAGREIPHAMHEYISPQQGNNLVLTIDQTIQYFVERELDKIVDNYNPTSAVIIVMDPKTGEVLAMGNRPTFNPNHWQDYQSFIWDRNPAIWYNYEPGSTFKIITASAALEENIVKMDDHFYCPGYIKVADRRIRCWKHGGHGSETFEEVVRNSCNPGFVEVGLNLGVEKFYKYIRAFGFGQLTNIELPGEARGIIIDEKDTTNLNIATMSIGHSIAVTPIQLVTAVSAAINGGHLMQPYIVKEIRDKDNKVIEKHKPKEIRRVISEDTSQRLRKLLEKVVMEGTGKNAYVEGYPAGGKTGTAQVVGESGGYVSGKYVASFAGFAPVDDPRIAVLIMIREPKGGVYYGGQVAAPVFAPLARDILRYMGVPEKRNMERPQKPFEISKQITQIEVPNVVNLPLNEAQKELRAAGLAFQTRGEGQMVYKQIPEAGAVVESGTTVLLDLNRPKDLPDGKVTMPDLTGCTIKEAGALLESIGLHLEASGTGLAAGQSVKPGSKIDKGTTVKITFEPPGKPGHQ
ncbi:stage V sporulation protein D (sporulation-specific penicillin-binding protein) [Desulfohalotomaculum tongense]|uniref:stage V sporulation protein D n=1 Tax=Desulforadius tongensis TaxID=1216062 RepID=UPI00195A732F|nr:stage V sporulation protein D [Desulforadius tongensis]MBM7855933.1 stage V sporulation protein D (sporulation-specific penicillin-binding protein) [Desulforadius tongensis]